MPSLLEGYRQANNKASRVGKMVHRELTKDQNCKLDNEPIVGVLRHMENSAPSLKFFAL